MEKKIRVGINGFGRIGRLVYRVISARKDIVVVAINGQKLPTEHVHMLKYDTVHGRYQRSLVASEGYFLDEERKVLVYREPTPEQIPWQDLDIDVVIEATGVFRKRNDIEGHIRAGAKKVILTVPAKDSIDATIVMGVNEHTLKPSDTIVSNASCTTNCLAPVAKVIHKAFGIVSGLMTTIHAYTNDQSIVDSSHKDLRRARAAGMNMIPTSTGAAKAIGEVIPELSGKLNGIAVRVPVSNGSLVDLTVHTQKEVTVASVNRIMKNEAEQSGGVLLYTEEPIVSSDIIGQGASSIFDGLSTMTQGANLLKVLSWYDNEWGYTCRVVNLLEKIATIV